MGSEFACVPTQSKFRFLSTSVIIHHICIFYSAIKIQMYREMEVIYFVSSPVSINQCGQ